MNPLDPSIIAEVDTRLRQIDRMMTVTAAQAARRLYVIADVLHAGKPQREMFLLAMAFAAMGAADCVSHDEGEISPGDPGAAFRSGSRG